MGLLAVILLGDEEVLAFLLDGRKAKKKKKKHRISFLLVCRSHTHRVQLLDEEG